MTVNSTLVIVWIFCFIFMIIFVAAEAAVEPYNKTASHVFLAIWIMLAIVTIATMVAMFCTAEPFTNAVASITGGMKLC